MKASMVKSKLTMGGGQNPSSRSHLRPSESMAEVDGRDFYGKPTGTGARHFKPPLPRAGDFGPGDVIRDGYSSRYQTKFPVKSLDEEVNTELDLETARYMIASLQLHNCETIETLFRKEQEIESANIELVELRGKLKDVLLLQDNLFAKFWKEKCHFDTKLKILEKENFNEQSKNLELQKRVEVVEESLGVVMKGDKDS